MLLIARREYLEQIRGRAFRLSTIGLPALFAVIIGVAYISSLGLGANKHLIIAANDAALANDIRNRLLSDKDGKAAVDIAAPALPDARAALIKQVQTREVDGVLWIETPAGGLPTATYTSQASGDFITNARLKDAVNEGLLDEHLTGAGMKQDEANAVVKGISIETFQARKDGTIVKSNAQASFWKGYVMAILLSMTTMIYGLNVARSIIQEKTSRIFEVMLATARPSDLLAGKLVGVGAVGLTQIGIWLVAGAAILITPFAAAILSGDPDVYAAGRGAHLAQLCVDYSHHQRLQLDLVDCGLVLPPHRAHHHVFAHGLADAAGMAVCGFHRPHGPQHLGHALVLFAPLPRGYPDVRQAGHAA
jgi:ABC-2 type transport system permease protein